MVSSYPESTRVRSCVIGSYSPPICKLMCPCPENHKRLANGICVPIDRCPLLCPSGEVELCTDPYLELCDRSICSGKLFSR